MCRIVSANYTSIKPFKKSVNEEILSFQRFFSFLTGRDIRNRTQPRHWRFPAVFLGSQGGSWVVKVVMTVSHTHMLYYDMSCCLSPEGRVSLPSL